MLNLAQASRSFVLILIAFGTASSATAQQAHSVAATPVPVFNGARSQGGYSTIEAITGDWQTVDVFTVPSRETKLPTGAPWIEYAARRVSGAPGEEGQVTWTSSRDCPALYNTLVWMTVLTAPRIEIAGVSPTEAEPAGRRPVTLTADGLRTTVWGRGTQPDHTMNTRVEVSSNGGLIAEFGNAATENLLQCWKSEQPFFSQSAP